MVVSSPGRSYTEVLHRTIRSNFEEKLTGIKFCLPVSEVSPVSYLFLCISTNDHNRLESAGFALLVTFYLISRYLNIDENQGRGSDLILLYTCYSNMILYFARR